MMVSVSPIRNSVTATPLVVPTTGLSSVLMAPALVLSSNAPRTIQPIAPTQAMSSVQMVPVPRTQTDAPMPWVALWRPH